MGLWSRIKAAFRPTPSAPPQPASSTPHLAVEDLENELVEIDRLLESNDPKDNELGERRMRQRHGRIADDDLVDAMSGGLSPTGRAWRETIATLGDLQIDAISRDYWQYIRRVVLVLVVDGREYLYKPVDDVDERPRVLEHLNVRDLQTRKDVRLDAEVLAARDEPDFLAVLDLLARFETAASDAQLATVTPMSSHDAKSVRRWSLPGTSGGWREVTCTIEWSAGAAKWRFERTVLSVSGEDGIALS